MTKKIEVTKREFDKFLEGFKDLQWESDAVAADTMEDTAVIYSENPETEKLEKHLIAYMHSYHGKTHYYAYLDDLYMLQRGYVGNSRLFHCQRSMGYSCRFWDALMLPKAVAESYYNDTKDVAIINAGRAYRSAILHVDGLCDE